MHKESKNTLNKLLHEQLKGMTGKKNEWLPAWLSNQLTTWPNEWGNEIYCSYSLYMRVWMGLTDQRMQTNADFSDKLMLSKEKCNCLSHNVVTLDVDHNVCTVNC